MLTWPSFLEWSWKMSKRFQTWISMASLDQLRFSLCPATLLYIQWKPGMTAFGFLDHHEGRCWCSHRTLNTHLCSRLKASLVRADWQRGISVHKVDSHSILTWTTRRFLLGPIKPLNSRSFIQDFSYQSSDRSSEEGCYHVEALGPMKRLTSNRAHVTKVRVATCLWPAAHVVAHDSFFHFIANAWPHCVWSKFRFSHCVQ